MHGKSESSFQNTRVNSRPALLINQGSRVNGSLAPFFAGSFLQLLDNVPKHLIEIGKRVQSGWRSVADRAGLTVTVSGVPPLSHFSFEDYENSQAMHTLFNQIMLEKGFLATKSFYAMYAHTLENVKDYLNAVDNSFRAISNAIKNGSLKKKLQGNPSSVGFKRLS